MPRKTTYKKNNWEDKLALIQGWARDGLTDEQIAKKMSIGITTLYDYKKKYPKFLKALKKGKEVVDYEVENALLQQALNGNTVAQIFWLKNRKPAMWRDKPSPDKFKEKQTRPLHGMLEDMRERGNND